MTKRTGWLCPACGRGNAPWLATCPCWRERSVNMTSATRDWVTQTMTADPQRSFTVNGQVTEIRHIKVSPPLDDESETP